MIPSSPTVNRPLAAHPVNCQKVNDHLGSHSYAHSHNLILEYLGLEPECFRLNFLAVSSSYDRSHGDENEALLIQVR